MSVYHQVLASMFDLLRSHIFQLNPRVILLIHLTHLEVSLKIGVPSKSSMLLSDLPFFQIVKNANQCRTPKDVSIHIWRFPKTGVPPVLLRFNHPKEMEPMLYPQDHNERPRMRSSRTRLKAFAQEVLGSEAMAEPKTTWLEDVCWVMFSVVFIGTVLLVFFCDA